MNAHLLNHLTIAFFILNLILILFFCWNKNGHPFFGALSSGFGLILLTSLWIYLERPPLRTLGETRLWYATLLPLSTLLFSYQLRLLWPTIYSLAMSSLFLLINILSPDVYDKTLVPALQSIWFVPHVVVYIISYAFLTAGFIFACKCCWEKLSLTQELTKKMDDLIRVGFFFLTAGLIFGAFWAKEAWGHYWTWDPKETWAFLTWAIFLFYFHFRHWYQEKLKETYIIVVISFLVLLMCWFGINALPIGQNSVHTY